MLHAREKMSSVDGIFRSSWEFEERKVSMAPTTMVLVRIVIGNVANVKRLESALRLTPVKGERPGWNCVLRLTKALEGVERDGKALGTSDTGWGNVRNTATRYVEQKKAQHRFDGTGNFDMSKLATWDMLGGRELVP